VTGGIFADPGAIASLGGEFLGAADQVDRQVAGADAQLADHAFGLLPAAQTAHAAYARQLAVATEDLHGLVATLRQFGENLRAIAANYGGADDAST
jgi:hypothetical protein